MSQIYKNASGGGGGGNLNTLTGDSGGAVSPDAGGNINVLGQPDINVNGNATPNTLTWTDLTKITPYTVDGALTAGTEVAYSTIQSAINAASGAGGGVVYIRPGQYTENLTLADNVDLYGTPAVSQNQGQSVTIIGTHTPPAAGHCGFNTICFVSTTDVFLSAAAGTTHLAFLNCESAVQNGYFLNLLNWTGILEIYDNNPSTAGAPFAVNDGGINNTGGATILVFSAGVGSGTNVMNLSGLVITEGASFGCPVNFQTGSNINLQGHEFLAGATFSGNSTGVCYFCDFEGGVNSAITMSSSAAISINKSVINSSNTNAIAGAGAGSLTLLDNTFPTSQQLGVGVILPNVTHLVRGTGQTVDVGTADLLTYALRNVAGVYSFEALVAGISVAGSAAAFQLTGVVKTNGAAATIVGTIDQIGNADLAIAGANVTGVVSANNFIIRATGSLGSVINWNVNWTFKQITN